MQFPRRTMRTLYFGLSSPFKTQINLSRNSGKSKRCLEIGPGSSRIPDFETLNIVNGRNVDYVWDAGKDLPFPNNTFDIIYASHILEHIPWYQTKDVLYEWVRVLKSGGILEVWVPDGLKICQAFVEAETSKSTIYKDDGWFRFNDDQDPCKWASGRIFTYGDGSGRINHPNWHRALFSSRYLKDIFQSAGLSYVEEMSPSDVRGYDHGWINLGMRGIKN